ncbi:MAG: hypothetical protein HY788_15120 [Deltaproteobacteria bacterium]|nr:hypothetical protein [Deltaproteobacteria bacterium]
MDFEIRELSRPDELEDVIKLQAVVGGLPPKDTMSPITLRVLTSDRPRTGWVSGAYLNCIGKAASGGFTLPSSRWNPATPIFI